MMGSARFGRKWHIRPMWRIPPLLGVTQGLQGSVFPCEHVKVGEAVGPPYVV